MTVPKKGQISSLKRGNALNNKKIKNENACDEGNFNG